MAFLSPCFLRYGASYLVFNKCKTSFKCDNNYLLASLPLGRLGIYQAFNAKIAWHFFLCKI